MSIEKVWHSLCLFNGPWVFPLSISKNWVSGGRQEYSLCLFVENRLLSSQGWTWTSSASLHIQQLHLSSPQMSQLFFFFFTLTLCFTLCFVFNVVAPPQDLQITDPGLLGSLDIEWKPPPNVQTFSECTVKYRFEYRNAGDRDWKVRQSTVYSS